MTILSLSNAIEKHSTHDFIYFSQQCGIVQGMCVLYVRCVQARVHLFRVKLATLLTGDDLRILVISKCPELSSWTQCCNDRWTLNLWIYRKLLSRIKKNEWVEQNILCAAIPTRKQTIYAKKYNVWTIINPFNLADITHYVLWDFKHPRAAGV